MSSYSSGDIPAFSISIIFIYIPAQSKPLYSIVIPLTSYSSNVVFQHCHILAPSYSSIAIVLHRHIPALSYSSIVVFQHCHIQALPCSSPVIYQHCLVPVPCRIHASLYSSTVVFHLSIVVFQHCRVQVLSYSSIVVFQHCRMPASSYSSTHIQY